MQLRLTACELRDLRYVQVYVYAEGEQPYVEKYFYFVDPDWQHRDRDRTEVLEGDQCDGDYMHESGSYGHYYCEQCQVSLKWPSDAFLHVRSDDDEGLASK